MIVPQFWAESRAQSRERNRSITIRRFGWSDTSEAEAQARADARAQEALLRALAGEKLERRELKRAYNGADGVPIREEIVSRHGDTVITRNSYGARCLNTPDVLFADVDFDTDTPIRPTCLTMLVLFIASIVFVVKMHPDFFGFMFGIGGGAILSGIVGAFIVKAARSIFTKAKGGPLKAAGSRIVKFSAQHPDWTLRIYRTPAGLRVLAMHRTFDPAEPAVADFFRALGTDPIYVRMCTRQHCFRARVSAKPWRAGISDHMRPSAVWPVAPEGLPVRREWVEKYEAAARSFAACALLETLGSGATDPKTRAVQELHDTLSHATTGLPLA
jgi:hypothetical protein